MKAIGVPFKRGADEINVLPENILVSPEENGRAFGLKPEKIKALAYKIAREGQKVPVRVRRIEGNLIKLTAGNYRQAAIAYINANKLTDEPMLVRCEVYDGNAEEAFKDNIIENRDREETGIIDDLHNINKASTKFGWTDEEICIFYGAEKPMSQSWLDQLRLLNRLSREEQEAIANATYSAAVGYMLADIPEERRAEMLALAALETPNGKVTQTGMLKAARKSGVLNRVIALKMPELKKTFEGFKSPEVPPKMAEFGDIFLRFQANTLTQEEFFEKAKGLFS